MGFVEISLSPDIATEQLGEGETMAGRGVLGWQKFRDWCREPRVFAETLEAEHAAMQHYERTRIGMDVETTSVILQHAGGDGVGVDCYTPPGQPFRLRVIATRTQAQEFRNWVWDSGVSAWVLEPRWFVLVIKDPLGRAAGATTPGTLAYILPVTYFAKTHPDSPATPLPHAPAPTLAT